MTSLLSVLALFAAAPEGPTWPGFLGPGATPVAEQSVPLEWSPSRNIAWKAPLAGYGQSSPVVWNDRVYVTTVEGPKKETCRVLALALSDGKPLWEHSLESSFPVENTQYVSRAAPTPAADENGVYVFFESGDLVALAHDGKPRWTRSLVKDHGPLKSNHGLAASPVLTESTVIVLVDHGGPSYLAAFRKSDGEPLWKTDRTSRQSWSSPALLNVGTAEGETAQVVVSSSGSVDGYDPATGKRLWTFDKVGGNTSCTPHGFDGLILIGASAGREGRPADAAKSNMALRVVKRGETYEAEPAWKAEDATSSFGSPMVHRGLAYFVNRVGVVYCLDAKTGEQKYAQRTKQSAWATPVGVGDRVYIFGKNGVTSVLAAGPKFEVLAENTLWAEDETASPARASTDSSAPARGPAGSGGPIQYGVAVVPRSILIRTGTTLYCVREQAEE